MIVCLCHGVSDRVLKEAIAKGAQSVSEIKRFCLIGEGCGQCLPVVEELIRSAQGENDAKRCRKKRNNFLVK